MLGSRLQARTFIKLMLNHEVVMLRLGADHVKVTEAEDNDVTLKRNLFHCGGGGPFIQ